MFQACLGLLIHTIFVMNDNNWHKEATPIECDGDLGIIKQGLVTSM